MSSMSLGTGCQQINGVGGLGEAVLLDLLHYSILLSIYLFRTVLSREHYNYDMVSCCLCIHFDFTVCTSSIVDPLRHFYR